MDKGNPVTEGVTEKDREKIVNLLRYLDVHVSCIESENLGECKAYRLLSELLTTGRRAATRDALELPEIINLVEALKDVQNEIYTDQIPLSTFSQLNIREVLSDFQSLRERLK